MEGKLVGVHKVKAKLKDGTKVEYYYAWRGGPRMRSQPGTPAFDREFARLTRDRPQKVLESSFGWLMDDYLKSAEYQKLRPSTKRDYDRIIGSIRVTFGEMPLSAFGATGARNIFKSWRDTMRDTPRSADMHAAVLARIVAWGVDRELISRNPLERFGKLHTSSRKDAIWMPSQIEAVMQAAPHIADVAKMALWTMQRQGDLLSMPTLAFSDEMIWIVQGKTGARVRIRPADEIKPLLARAKAENRQRVLVHSYGQNWTESGFRASWRKEMSRLGIKGVTFHDLRGTGISYAYANGMDIEQIADISGHTKGRCEAIIRKNYLAGGDVIEAIRAGTKGVK